MADWWNLAFDAARMRLGSPVLLEAAAGIARDAGRSLAFTESQAILQLYSYASRMANAADNVQNALDSDVIGADHLATAPWARDEQVVNTAPIWHVVYDFSYIDSDGILQTDKKTSVFDMTFPGTIGDLRAAIDEDAQALAAKYRVTFDSTNVLMINVV